MTAPAAPFTQLGSERQTDGLWKHTGRLIVDPTLEMAGPASGLILPAGSVTTSMLAQDSVQHLVGAFSASVTWTLGVTNVWTETPIMVDATLSGARVRVEFGTAITLPTKGQRIYWGIMLDGATSNPLGVMDAPEAGYAISVAGTYYSVPTPGFHHVALALYGPSGTTIISNCVDTLYLTEQKR